MDSRALADLIAADVARSVGAETIDQLAARHPELTAAERNRALSAMDRYVTELAEEQDRLRVPSSPGRLDDMLVDLEREGADLQ